jgi:hypothetical protein
LVTQLIQRGLASVTAPKPEQQPNSLPVAIERVPGSPLTPALNNAQLYAILDQEDMAQYQRVLQQSSVSE